MPYTGPESKKVHSMFSEIASQYDLANSVLSLGIHHLWRKKLVQWSGATEGKDVLDCATGTGDLALEFKKHVGSGKVIGTDFCAPMLDPAHRKAKKSDLDVAFSVADVQNLPFESESFDISSISFGIRNVNDPVKGLSELARVVRPGGVVMILEFGQVNIPLIKELYSSYSEKVLPKLGGIVTGKPEAYEYLQKSSSKFPCKDDFIALMNQTGQFSKCEYKPVSFGIAYIYRGIVSLKA